jgi:hypothetical protein
VIASNEGDKSNVAAREGEGQVIFKQVKPAVVYVG